MRSVPEPGEIATFESITSVLHWTPSLYSFKTTRPAEFRFTPGQYARLGLRNDRGIQFWRAYSIVSGADDDELEYFVIDVPGGAFTSILRTLQPGDGILLDKKSYGFMTPDRFVDGAALWMLSTGTGLGPFISILRDPFTWERFSHLVLVHSVRNNSELAYRVELRDLQERHAGAAAKLQYIATTTRDPLEAPAEADANNPAPLHGRITTLLESGELERCTGLSLDPASARVMLCGNPQMIDEMRGMLHRRDMRPCRRATPGQFVTENYW